MSFSGICSSQFSFISWRKKKRRKKKKTRRHFAHIHIYDFYLCLYLTMYTVAISNWIFIFIFLAPCILYSYISSVASSICKMYLLEADYTVDYIVATKNLPSSRGYRSDTGNVCGDPQPRARVSSVSVCIITERWVEKAYH